MYFYIVLSLIKTVHKRSYVFNNQKLSIYSLVYSPGDYE